jgi:membrane protein DedA with SNARE-associated domain
LDFTPLLHHYGYLALFAGAFLEGETVLLIAGFLVHEGYFSPLTTGLIAMLGGTAGDQVSFYLGRRYADKIIAHLPPHLRMPVGFAKKLVANNPTFVLLTMRFLVGMRMVLPLLCGAARIRASRFIAFNMATAVVWAALFLFLGYLFGEAAKPFLKGFQAAEAILVVALILFAIIYHRVTRRVVKRMEEKREGEIS